MPREPDAVAQSSKNSQEDPKQVTTVIFRPSSTDAECTAYMSTFVLF